MTNPDLPPDYYSEKIVVATPLQQEPSESVAVSLEERPEIKELLPMSFDEIHEGVQRAVLESTSTIEDNSDAWYSIFVYEFNKSTGNGWALVENKETRATDKTRISFKEYIHKNKKSIYTDSLHTGKKNNIVAKATRRVTGAIAKLVISNERLQKD